MTATSARTVDAKFREAAHRYPERRFLRLADGSSRTYADVVGELDVITEQLQSFGLCLGDRVVFYLEAPVPSLLFNLACAHLGVIPVPLSPSFSSRALAQLVERLGAKAIVTDPAHADRPERSVPVLSLPGALPVGVTAVDQTPRRPYGEALDRLARLPRHEATAPYLFQPTSGTTGEPKLIIRSHAVFDRIGRILAHDLRAADDPAPERLLLVAALTHGMGQYALATMLHMCGELCIPSEIDTACSLAEVRTLDPTCLIVTPRVLRSLLTQRVAEDTRWFGPSAHIVFIGGAAPQPELITALEREGLFPSEGYGASEISILAQTRRSRYRAGTSGEILPDVTLRIADDGELLAKSPGVMLGYFGDEALTRQAFTDDGFYHTGDYAEITPDGYLRYLGRKRDVFNTSEGSNIHPGRVESLIEALPWVRQVVLVGDQRPYMAALITIDDASPASAEPDGFLDERTHAAAYERARTSLAPINASLETIEQVKRLALFDRRFADELVRVVGHSKVSRNRRLFGERYAARIAELYT
jgi:long-chain acyl-CoA synthetase